jgi:heat-inducible transcriptional repressor
MRLSVRQQAIVNVVADLYIRSGVPVSSKAVAGVAEFKVSPSTVRNEFAVLEETGYLTHPHTSAGRMPTSQGYREFVDFLLQHKAGGELVKPPVLPESLGREVDVALQQTSEAMSQATNLLALVVAPFASGARVRHVELLRLQPMLVMVVFILSTGRVTKHIVDFPAPVDPGTVKLPQRAARGPSADRTPPSPRGGERRAWSAGALLRPCAEPRLRQAPGGALRRGPLRGRRLASGLGFGLPGSGRAT